MKLLFSEKYQLQTRFQSFDVGGFFQWKLAVVSDPHFSHKAYKALEEASEELKCCKIVVRTIFRTLLCCFLVLFRDRCGRCGHYVLSLYGRRCVKKKTAFMFHRKMLKGTTQGWVHRQKCPLVFLRRCSKCQLPRNKHFFFGHSDCWLLTVFSATGRDFKHERSTPVWGVKRDDGK